MAVALGTLAVNISSERSVLILKRLGGTPLPRPVLITAKALAGSVLIAMVVAVLILVGTRFYGAHLVGNTAAALLVLLLGIGAFATMGIVMGGIAKPDSAVALSNLVYLGLSFLGGVFVPLDQFPSGLRTVAGALPSERMVDALQTIWTRGGTLGDTGWDIPILLAWALFAVAIGARRFRWE